MRGGGFNRVVGAVNDHRPDRLGEESRVPDTERRAIGRSPVGNLLHAQTLSYHIHVQGDIGAVQLCADRSHRLDAQAGGRLSRGYLLGRIYNAVVTDRGAQRHLLTGLPTREFWFG